MADEAHKEPTMEEILSSIRKIISEDEAPAEEVKAPEPVGDVPELAEAAVNDDFEDLLLEDTPEDIELSEDNGEVSYGEDLNEDEIFESLTSDTYEEVELEEEIVAEDDLPEPTELIDDEPSAPEIVEETPAPVEIAASNQEAQMAATAKYESTILTDERTADAAAGSLGQLISKMDLGGDNTIEGLVRELLRPMIKDWLDANLPSIVEEKVEAEVQRIARMAR